jgi:hypothetical protein
MQFENLIGIIAGAVAEPQASFIIRIKFWLTGNGTADLSSQ